MKSCSCRWTAHRCSQWGSPSLRTGRRWSTWSPIIHLDWNDFQTWEGYFLFWSLEFKQLQVQITLNWMRLEHLSNFSPFWVVEDCPHIRPNGHRRQWCFRHRSSEVPSHTQLGDLPLRGCVVIDDLVVVVANKHQFAILSIVLGCVDGVYVRVGTQTSKPMLGANKIF